MGIKILIVDDHTLFREGLVSLFHSQPTITIVGEAGTGGEALAQALTMEPDVILMDIGLPDMDGLDVIKSILEQRPEMKIIILTVYDNDELLFEAIRRGAKGYLLKNTPVTKLIAAVHALERGEAALSRTMTGRVLEKISTLTINEIPKEEMDALTPRQVEILRLIAHGASNKQIAESLYLSENTVKVHIHNILKKLKVRKRHEAVNFARRRGLI